MSLGASIGSIIGSALGFWLGGPLGAAIGATIGGMIGGYVDPTEFDGPGVGETPVQTSREGVPIPITWGLQHMHGNVIQVAQPYERTRKVKVDFSTRVKVTRRYQTFVIGVCEGPIEGFSRIWQNEKLVYDINQGGWIQEEPIAEGFIRVDKEINNEFLVGDRRALYLGTDDQTADPDLEAMFGTGLQPSYKGLAYAVFKYFDTTDYGAIPSYRFEVNGSFDASVSSKIYPLEVTEGTVTAQTPDAGRYMPVTIEGTDTAQTPQSGTLRAPLVSYENWPEEGTDTTQTPQSGTLRVALNSYENWPEEGTETTQTPDSGTLRSALVSYDCPAEGTDTTQTPVGGTLT